MSSVKGRLEMGVGRYSRMGGNYFLGFQGGGYSKVTKRSIE